MASTDNPRTFGAASEFWLQQHDRHLLGVGVILLSIAMTGWSGLSILYSTSYQSPLEIAGESHVFIEALVYSILFLAINIISLTISVNILAIGAKLLKDKSAKSALLILATQLAAYSIATSLELINFGDNLAFLPILSGILLIASILLLRRKKIIRERIAAGILILSALGIYYLTNPWEPVVTRITLQAIFYDNEIILQILNVSFPGYVFPYLLGASQLLFVSIGLGLFSHFVFPKEVIRKRERFFKFLWLGAFLLFGVCFVILGSVSGYTLFGLLRAQLGSSLDPLLAMTINLSYLELEAFMGFMVFIIGLLSGAVFILISISGIVKMFKTSIN